MEGVSCNTLSVNHGSSSVNAPLVQPSIQLREDIRELEKMNIMLLDRVASLESNLKVALEVASENLCRAECAEVQVARLRALLLAFQSTHAQQSHVDSVPAPPTPAGKSKAPLEMLEVMLELESVATQLQQRTERCAELEDEVRLLRKPVEKYDHSSEPYSHAANKDEGCADFAKPPSLEDLSRSAHPGLTLPQPCDEPEEEHFSSSILPSYPINYS